jgi:cytochrome P450
MIQFWHSGTLFRSKPAHRGALDVTFSFGRRICVGRHTADATVWACIVSVLSTFNIEKAKDSAGNEIDINPAYSDGFLRYVGRLVPSPLL